MSRGMRVKRCGVEWRVVVGLVGGLTLILGAGVLACWIRGDWHLASGAPALHVRFARYKSGVCVCVGLLKPS